MYGTRKYHPESSNTDPKGLGWYVLTDKYILAKKFRIPIIQLSDHRKLKNLRKDQVWIVKPT